MNFVNKYGKGILVCLLIAIPSWIIGKMFPVIGGAVIAILAGMIIAMFWNDRCFGMINKKQKLVLNGLLR